MLKLKVEYRIISHKELSKKDNAFWNYPQSKSNVFIDRFYSAIKERSVYRN